MGRRIGVLAVGLLVLLLWAGVVAAAPPDDDATCDISVTVAEIMEWESDFSAISLANITSQATTVSDTSTMTLYTNGDVDITADRSTNAELIGPDSDTLVTEYGLAYDGNGVAATGGSTVSFTTYDAFLSSASSVTHVPGDGAVEVTLSVRASNAAGTLANAGLYSATQTLTASWAS
jgi:hypothetical protein